MLTVVTLLESGVCFADSMVQLACYTHLDIRKVDIALRESVRMSLTEHTLRCRVWSKKRNLNVALWYGEEKT